MGRRRHPAHRDHCQKEDIAFDKVGIFSYSIEEGTPAASLPLIVKRNGGVLIEVNPHRTELSNVCDVCIRATSGESLLLLVDEIREML